MDFTSFNKNSLIAVIAVLTIAFAGPLKAAEVQKQEPKQTQASQQESNQLPSDEVQRFTNTIGLIKNYYVKPTDNKALLENAIRGMVAGLDPHSSYLDEKDLKELQDITQGEFGGLGIEVTMEDGIIKVISPIEGSPAYKAGVKPGDYIIIINDKAVKGMTLPEAVSLMRGPKGTSIKLTIMRKNEPKPLIINVTRDTVVIQSIKSRLIDKKYGYIRITQFQANTADDLMKAMNALKKQAGTKLAGLILDLRDNPGGLLDSAIQISDDFLQAGQKGKHEVIVYTKGRLPGSDFTAYTTRGDVLEGAPMVVLINEGSASGSEIVAGALKDNKRALVIGTRSFGKGSVQTVLPLDSQHAVKLTTALYYTPSGVSIQASGISPDVEVQEIKIPKSSVAENPDITALKESQLKGHFSSQSSNATEADQEAKDKNLLYDDYQLYEALNLLKGLIVEEKKVGKNS
ncbi:MAG: S41 family peptidase [Proteobacteria bacterium]|nr:S41 family peptidase [Pseudomonadota bacterium]